MEWQHTPRWGRAAVVGLLFLGLAQADARADYALSDNITGVGTAGTEAATGSNWLAASFSTGASAALLNSVTLLLENPVAGGVEVDIYGDGGMQPGSLVGTLTSPTSFPGPLVESTFTTAGINLAADSTYWVVVHATSGEFDWAYASSDDGGGPGFTDTWASSFDSGNSWFAFVPYTTPGGITLGTDPLQMIVLASPVPAPSSMIMMSTGAGLLLWNRHFRGRRTA